MVGKKAGRKGLSAEQRRRRAARARSGGDDRSDYKSVRKAEKITAANKKSGCGTKLFMFALPFAAVGAFLLLSN